MPSYRNILPVIQSGWYTCWAASTSWWTQAMTDRARGFMTEQDMMDKFSCDWDKNGAMTLKGLADIFREPKFNMNFRFGNAADLDRIIYNLSEDAVKSINAFPIIIGYNDPRAGGNHCAVLCEFDLDISYQKLVVMDPAKGYRVRSRDYLASQNMVFAWPKEAGDITSY
ncbi:MAG TPA: hypothetical protein VGC76_09395 [Pyrinomonadaceae bacterium]|jgi:hypothetical protein